MAVRKRGGRKSAADPKPALAPFHERFEIQLGVSEATERFMSRVSNYIVMNFINADLDHATRTQVLWQVANALGHKFDPYFRFESYVGRDFHRHLQALEASYAALSEREHKATLDFLINLVLTESEVDLGISWKKPFFVRTGAKLLDDYLVNESLKWLSGSKYRSAFAPFEKGLSHFLESEKKPKLLPDVITDMYESVEALAKIVTGRVDKDLSANAELFVKVLRVSDYYKQLLRHYIAYANHFRHAVKAEGKRPTLSIPEVESFVYLTGIFVRLAITSTAQSSE